MKMLGSECGRTARAPALCLAVPVVWERLTRFFLVVGSLQERSAGAISDRELCHSLRKAATGVDRGGF